MGTIVIPRLVKLVSGILGPGDDWLARGRETLARKLGKVDLESEIFPFDFTDYYDAEFGRGLLRQFISFRDLVSAEQLAGIKIITNEMERSLSEGGRRRANLDPGYVDLSKLVLATTKDATYRVYLGKGIYAQPTLFFRKGTFCPWEWTYPDYREPSAIEFFNRVRERYKEKIKEVNREP